jgi:hypothetical protein
MGSLSPGKAGALKNQMDVRWLGHISNRRCGGRGVGTLSYYLWPASHGRADFNDRSTPNHLYELIPMEQCHWIWDSSKLPAIGDLSEARLFLHSLPLYLKTRDEYRAEREGLPPKWASLNISTIRLLPVGSSWKMLKRFCFITFDKYAHGRNRVKGKAGRPSVHPLWPPGLASTHPLLLPTRGTATTSSIGSLLNR